MWVVIPKKELRGEPQASSLNDAIEKLHDSKKAKTVWTFMASPPNFYFFILSR
jgi:hypothetical protein